MANESNPKLNIDIPYINGVDLGKAPQHDATRQFPPNANGGIKISDDVWSEWIAVAQYLCRVFPDPDVYDLFMWIREELNSCQPLSDSYIERADQEIERELVRESRQLN